MSRIVKHFNFLSCLAESQTASKRTILINWASDKHIRTICEIALNIRKGTLPLPENIVKKLAYHRKILRFLSKKKGVNLDQKRNILKKSAGFIKIFPLILEAVKTHLPELAHSSCI